MKKIRFPELTDRNAWFLENRAVRIGIEKRTGWLRSVEFKRAKCDLFGIRKQDIPGYVGHLRVHDEYDEVTYSELTDRIRVVRASKRGNRVTVVKRFVGAPFELKVTFELDKRALTWTVEATKADAKVADRSLRVGFNMPLHAGWKVWAPCHGGDFAFDGMDDFNFNHVQVSYVSPRDIILPMVSHYSPSLDVGYSILEPIEAKVPAAKFQFENGQKCFNWGYTQKHPHQVQSLECLNYYIGLAGDRTMRTEVKLLFHEGDWRPALGQVYEMYREYFDPDSPEIYESEGVYHCGGVDVGRDTDFYTDLELKCLEVHGHFSYYGDYFYEGEDDWIALRVWEGLYRKWRQEGKPKDAYEVLAWLESHNDEEVADEFYGPDWRKTYATAAEAVRNHRAEIKRMLQRIADAGIHPFWYFNYTDGYRPLVEQRWPDSICRRADGEPIPSGWQMCHNMLGDPKVTSFGKFLDRSVVRIIHEYPELRGFFLDCFRHYEVDFAHDDGITVADHLPAYSVNFSYDELTARMKKHFRKTGRPMSLFANKPQTIRSMRHVDAVLEEGDGDVHEGKYFWACIAKPIYFLWTSNRATSDENLRRSVLNGAFPRIPKEAFQGKSGYRQARKMFDAYLPLCEHFRRRVLCFEPDPMRVPKGARGRLFTVGDDYVAVIATLSLPDGAKVRHARTPYAMFRVARGHDIGEVLVHYAGQAEPEKADFKFNGTFIAVPMPRYNHCAAVILRPTRKTGKKIGAEKFTGLVDQCGDPESSFQDISDR
jgi:hypothetical protein